MVFDLGYYVVDVSDDGLCLMFKMVYGIFFVWVRLWFG